MYLQGMPPILPAPSKGAKGGGAKITLPQLAGPLPGMPPNLPAPQRSARPIQLPQTRPSAGGSDAATSGPNYGAAQANAFKQSPAYRQAILDVFQHQPAAQRIALVNGAQRTPSLEGNLILQALHGGPVVRSGMPGAGLVQYTRNAAKGPSLLSQLGDLGKSVLRADFGTPGGKGESGGGTASVMFGGQKGAKQLFSNAGKDIVNLPGNTIQGLAKVGGQIGSGHLGAAASSFFDPYIAAFADPSKAFYQHPGNTVLMFGGPEAIAGRFAGAVARSGALGDKAAAAASTARAPLRLGPDVAGAPSPIEDASRSYSPNVITKAAQVAREQALRKRGLDPNVARPKPRVIPKPIANSLNIGLEAKTRQIPNEMTAVRQMAGREHRTQAGIDTNRVRPHKSVQDTVSHILQGVIRTPDLAVEDIVKEINRLKAAQTGRRTLTEIFNRRQVRDLSRVLTNPEHLQAAFDSAARLRGPSHAADAYSVQAGILDPEQATRSRIITYAMAHMGATYDHGLGEFVDHTGAPLPTQTILDHIKASGTPDPAYVGHYPGKVAPWRFYQAYKAARGTLGGVKRTGEAFRSGGYDHTYDALVAQAARTAEAVTKAGLHDRIVNRLGIGKPPALQQAGENGYFTPAEARRYARASVVDDHGNPIPGAQPLVPLTAFNAKTPFSAIAGIQHPSELQHVDGLELQALARAVNDAGMRNDGTRNVVLVPEHAMDQFKQQFAPAGKGARKIGQVTQQFRRTVLPYSTHWMAQIASEAVLRGMIAGVIDPRNIRAGSQLKHALKTSEEGKNVLREGVNATYYNRHDQLAKFNPNPSPSLQAIKHTPVGVIIAAHNHYANFIGSAMGKLEHEFRVMGMGKFARQQVQEFTGSYQAGIGLQAKNVAMLADKLKTDPALVARLGRQIDDTFGKYNKLSPQVRSAVQSFVPFLPWYLNAAKFVLYNLPVKHPVASSLLASLRQTINQDVQDGKAMPLNQFQAEALAKFTPWGLIPPNPTVGSTLQAATGPILPQAAGAYNVLHGQSVFGDSSLRGPGGQVKPFANATVAPAIEALLEAVMPGLSKARTVAEGGGKAYGTSTLLNPQTKPGTSGGLSKILDRLFNPLHAFESAGKSSATTNIFGTAGSGSSKDIFNTGGSSGSQTNIFAPGG